MSKSLASANSPDEGGEASHSAIMKAAAPMNVATFVQLKDLRADKALSYLQRSRLERMAMRNHIKAIEAQAEQQLRLHGTQLQAEREIREKAIALIMTQKFEIMEAEQVRILHDLSIKRILDTYALLDELGEITSGQIRKVRGSRSLLPEYKQKELALIAEFYDRQHAQIRGGLQGQLDGMRGRAQKAEG